MNNLTRRIIVAAIGIPAVTWIIASGSLVFVISLLGVSTLAGIELCKLSTSRALPNRYVVLFLGLSIQVGIALALLLGLRIDPYQFIVAGLAFSTIIALCFELWRNHGSPLANVAATLFVVLYVFVLFSTMMFIRLLPGDMWLDLVSFQTPVVEPGAALLFALFAGVWGCDISAYFVGKYFGKHRLFERVSPKKTWEGSIGGFLVGAAATYYTMEYLVPGFPANHQIILAVLIPILGQIGDLVESLLKRDAGIKNSSDILPGHGGLLDRFDSLLLSTPVYLFYLLAMR